MPRGPQPCDRCQALATVRYRVQVEAQGVWQLVCPGCQAQVSQDNPHYRYGGTWKARQR
ncbi:hypothetical protein [Synechococcus elongatus]|uniref:hypothetical protein n=1 Tax=Synechococcus elongatus TaxID=32046 RepID=UPI001864E652|nr:hypothetical protein [Synechococcus elongatus]